MSWGSDFCQITLMRPIAHGRISRPNLNQIVASYVFPSAETMFACPVGPCTEAESNFVPIGAMPCRNEMSPGGNITRAVRASDPGSVGLRGVSTRRNKSFDDVTIVTGPSRVSSVAQYMFAWK